MHTIDLMEPTDNWLMQRVQTLSSLCNINVHPNLQFLNTEKDLALFFRKDKKNYFQTSFYKQQRKKLNILLDKDQRPTGGKWTYDSDNRKKYPKKNYHL